MALALSFLVILLWKVPKRQVTHVLNIQNRLTAENAARQTLAQIIGGVVLILGLFFTWVNLKITQETATKNIELAQERQITDRFTKAIEQLKDDNITLRLGGIYALEQIAKECDKCDNKYHWPIMEILTAYIRKNTPRSPKEATSVAAEAPRPRKFAPDIEAVLTVLKRRTWSHEKEGQCPSQANLEKEEQCPNWRSTNLSQANLEKEGSV